EPAGWARLAHQRARRLPHLSGYRPVAPPPKKAAPAREPERPRCFRIGPKLAPTAGATEDRNAANCLSCKQARQESNLQPPVLETGALPIELRTYRVADGNRTRNLWSHSPAL